MNVAFRMRLEFKVALHFNKKEETGKKRRAHFMYNETAIKTL